MGTCAIDNRDNTALNFTVYDQLEENVRKKKNRT